MNNISLQLVIMQLKRQQHKQHLFKLVIMQLKRQQHNSSLQLVIMQLKGQQHEQHLFTGSHYAAEKAATQTTSLYS